MDEWKGKKNANGRMVAQAYFEFGDGEVEALVEFAKEALSETDDATKDTSVANTPSGMRLYAKWSYGNLTDFCVTDLDGTTIESKSLGLSQEQISEWANKNVP